MNYIKTNSFSEQGGNILFFILIAVALFAALTYAVTMSTRSGAGAGDEKHLVSSSAMLQHTALVRATVAGMHFKGTTINEMEFNKPEDFASCSNPKVCVFHPGGGGISYVPVDDDFMAPGATNKNWGFTSIFEVEGIGMSSAGDFEGNDPIMFLLGVDVGACEKLHEKLKLSVVPDSTIPDVVFQEVLDGTANHMDSGWSPMGLEMIIGEGDTSDLEGQPQGCLKTNQGTYVFYSVLLER